MKVSRNQVVIRSFDTEEEYYEFAPVSFAEGVEEFVERA